MAALCGGHLIAFSQGAPTLCRLLMPPPRGTNRERTGLQFRCKIPPYADSLPCGTVSGHRKWTKSEASCRLTTWHSRREGRSLRLVEVHLTSGSSFEPPHAHCYESGGCMGPVELFMSHVSLPQNSRAMTKSWSTSIFARKMEWKSL